MRKRIINRQPVIVLSVFLCLLILFGLYTGFNSRGSLYDRMIIIGEPVPEGIVAVHDFDVPVTQSERDAYADSTEQSTPVFLRRNESISGDVSDEIEEIVFVATGSSTMAEYFGERARTFYETGLVDIDALRLAYSGSRAVLIGKPEENISELFTVQEAREGMRLDLQRRGFPEEKIPQITELIVANLSIDSAARDSALAASLAGMPETMKSFSTGDIILPAGGLFTEEIRRYREAMLADPSGSRNIVAHNLAKTGLSALLIGLSFVFLLSGPVRLLSTVSEVLLLFSAWTVTLVLTALLTRSGIQETSVFTFTMLGASITSVFFDSRAKSGFPGCSWFLAAMASSIFALHSPHPMSTFFLAFIPSCAVSFFMMDLSDTGVFKALVSGMLSSFIVFGLLVLGGSAGSSDLSPAVWLLLCGIPLVVTGMVRILVHPLELLFRVVSPLTYSRLERDTHPLREELRTNAAGTYEHSLNVATLAGKAAEMLGLDARLSALGGIYHDIGKLEAPGMFIENMKDTKENNPHDRMSPLKSAEIIMAHVYDGVKLAKKYHLPLDLRDIIEQHHGDSSVGFFLEKARRELPPGGTLDESLFHYQCPRPRSPEAALVLLADSASSAVKGLGPDASPELKAETVVRIIRENAEEGQLDQCHFTPSMQKKVAHMFIDSLGAINHERVKNYPHGK
ncbi:hypothetical protein CSA37_11965 [Candidatus Fermentibacteria bacterium]|nr:MAG: hypothetical protein CSA37_11965 [Candidatus Fermentibacteria bacterium]